MQECVGDALMEQTELQVSLGDGPVQIWRTVAVEGKRARCAHLVGEVLLACTRQATGGRLELCGGYPAFVLRLANEAAAQAEPAAPGSSPTGLCTWRWDAFRCSAGCRPRVHLPLLQGVCTPM